MKLKKQAYLQRMFPKNGEKQPRLRFPGFTGDWQPQQLGTLFSESREQNGSQFGADRLISVAQMKWRPSDRRDAGQSLSEYRVLRKGDITFEGNRSGGFPYGRFVLDDLGDGIASSRFRTFRPKHPLNQTFWKYLIHNDYTMRRILIRSTKKGTLMNELVPSDFLRQKVLVPSADEQRALGDFFTTLDSLISAAERKRELLKLKKQAFLQRMFPKRGETRPRLRFAGFTEDWEHQRIGTIIRTYLRRDYLASEIHGKGAFPVIQQGDSPIAGYSDGKSFNAYEQVVLFGDHTLSLYKPSSPFLLATDGVQIIGSDKISACFLFFLLERYLPSDRGYKRHLSQLKSAYCSFPPTNEEQQLVGNFFKQIDSLISSCESQIRVLQQLKQGYMQQMFV